MELSETGYKDAVEQAEKNMSPTHPIRLGLMLNFSVFYYEIMDNHKEACKLAKKVIWVVVVFLFVFCICFFNFIYFSMTGIWWRHCWTGSTQGGFLQRQYIDNAAPERQLNCELFSEIFQ